MSTFAEGYVASQEKEVAALSRDRKCASVLRNF
jgi:hypothetical protein